jgi:chemotaxis regulatin CheY-phosphate phosphatase CheZ
VTPLPPPAPGAARTALLYDTEAMLRLVDGELRALGGDEGGSPPEQSHAAAPDGLAGIPVMLERAAGEIRAVLAALRDGRTALEAATVEKLQRTGDKLREVTSATEVAATDILDALDRAQGALDDLDAADDAGDRARARRARARLREEVFGMVGALQFQDITTQQLAHAATVLAETEERLLAAARLFDPAAALLRAAAAPDPRTFDPRATTRGADERQALADEIFLAR